MRRRTFVRACGLAGAAWLLSEGTAAAADRISVVAELDRAKTEVGEAVELTVQVEREGEDRGDTPEPTLPDLAKLGLTLAAPPSSFFSTSSSVHFGTGRGTTIVTRSVHTYAYLLVPTRPGKFELPVFVQVGKTKVESTTTPTLEVTGTAAPAQPVVPGEDAGPTEAQGDIFLWTRVDKPSLYVGEQLTYALEIYERLPFPPGLQLRQLPGFQDFWSEELPEGTLRQEVVDGTVYRARALLRRALFPQKAGKLTITGPAIGVSMRRRLSARPTVIEVKPLPAGAPAGFSPNNVGLYTISAEADRKQLKVGEPFTLTVTIRGTGNIRVIDPGPWPEMPGLRRYDPKVDTKVTAVTQVGGERRYSFLVIPERGGKLTVPEHRFHFFDPAAAHYTTVASEPIALEVEGDPGQTTAGASEPAAPEAERTGVEEEGILAPLVTPEALPRASGEESWLTPSRWAWGMAGVPVVLAAGSLGTALWRRFGPDEASRVAAERAARQRALIAQAERGVAGGDGFYNALAQLLQAAAVDRAGPEGEGLPRGSLLALLRRQGVAEADTQQLGALLDRCDAARFGAASEGPEARQAALTAALDLLRASSLARGKVGAS